MWLSAVAIKHSHDGVHFNGFTLLEFDFSERARGGRRNLSVNFVGRDLEQRLVAVDVIADVLQPFRYCSFRNGLAHLRHYHFSSHDRSNSIGLESGYGPTKRAVARF